MPTGYEKFLRERGAQRSSILSAATRIASGPSVDSTYDDYDSQAMVPAEYAAEQLEKTKESARRQFDKYGDRMTPSEREQLLRVAETGDLPHGNVFMNLLNIIDTPAELIRLGIADIFGTDEYYNVEIEGRDYWNALTGKEASVRESLGELAGEGQFLVPGARVVEAMGAENKIVQGVGGFAFDLLTDPLNYISFGTFGLGKKLAVEGAQASLSTAAKAAARAVTEGTQDALTGLERRVATAMIDRAEEVAPAIAARFRKQVTDAAEIGVDEALDSELMRLGRLAAIDAETRAARIAAGEKLDDVADIVKGAYDDAGLTFGAGDVANDITELVANKHFGTLEDRFEDFISYEHTPSVATGGLKLVTPFFRKQFQPIGGVLRNDWSLKQTVDGILDKLPGPAGRAARDMYHRLDRFYGPVKGAMEGQAWTMRYAENAAKNLAGEVLGDAPVGLLRASVTKLNKAAEAQGFDKATSDKFLVRILGAADATREAHQLRNEFPEFTEELVEQYMSTAQAVRGVLGALREGAIASGMEIGKIDSYFPMLASKPFREVVDLLGERSVKITWDHITDPETKMGMQIVSELVGGSMAIKNAGTTDQGASIFAQKRVVSRHLFHSLGDHLQMIDLEPDGAWARYLAEVKEGYLTHDAINRAVKKALDVLADQNPRFMPSRKKLAAMLPYEEDVGKVLDTYIGSITQAINYRHYARELKRIGLMKKAPRRIQAGDTLAETYLAVGPATRNALEEIMMAAYSAAEFHGERALTMTTVAVNRNWTMQVPAAVVEDPHFRRALKKVTEQFEKSSARYNSMMTDIAVQAKGLEMIGVSPPLARKMAAAWSDRHLVEALEEIREIGNHQADAVMAAFAEQMMSAADDILSTKQLERATQAAQRLSDKIRRGTRDTIREMRDKWEKQFTRDVIEEIPLGKMDLLKPGGDLPEGGTILSRIAHEIGPDWERDTRTTLDELHREATTKVREHMADLFRTRRVTLGKLFQMLPSSVADDAWRRLGLKGKWNDFANSAAQTAAKDLTLGKVLSTLPEDKADDLWARLALIATRGEAGPDIMNQTLGKLLEGVPLDIADDIWRRLGFGRLRGEAAEGVLNLQAAPFIERMNLSSIFSIDPNHPKITDTYWMLWKAAHWKKGLTDDEIAQSAAVALSNAREMLKQATTAVKVRAANHGKVLKAMVENDTTIIMAEGNRQSLLEMLERRGINTDFIHFPPEGGIIWFPKAFDNVHENVDFDGVIESLREYFAYGRWEVLPTKELRVARPTDEWGRFRLLQKAMALTDEELMEAPPDIRLFVDMLGPDGELPFEMEVYENLLDLTRDLALVSSELKTSARVTKTMLDNKVALNKGLTSVLKEVEGVLNNKPPGRLAVTWTRHVSDLKRLLPSEEFGPLQQLVEYLRGTARLGQPGQRMLERNIKETRRIWTKLEDATEEFNGWVDEATEIARANARSPYDDAADTIYTFQESILRFFKDWGVETMPSGTPRFPAFFDDDFDEAFKAIQEEGKELGAAIETVMEGTRGFGRRGMPPKPQLPQVNPRVIEGQLKPQGPRKIMEEMAERASNLKPQRHLTAESGWQSPALSGLAGDILEGVVVPDYVRHILENMARELRFMSTPLGIRQLAEDVRGFTKLWRASATVARPTFVPRNIVTGIMNGRIANVGMGDYITAFGKITRLRRLMEGGGLTPAEALARMPLRDQSWISAFFDSGLMNTTYASTLRHVGGKPPINAIPWNEDFALFRAGGDVMQRSEDWMRAAAFHRWYDPSRPETVEFAKQMAIEIHFDYQFLTQAERRLTKIVPFFVWTRRNIPLQLRVMLEQPGFVNKYQHLITEANEFFGEDDEADPFLTSNYMSGLTVETDTILHPNTPFWEKLLFSPQVPVGDLEEAMRAFAPGDGPAMGYLMGMIHPAIGALWTAERTATYKDVPAPVGLREILMAFGTTTSGDVMVSPGTAAAFNTAIPYLKEWTNVLGIRPSDPRAQSRLGYMPGGEEGVGDSVRAAALTLGRAGGASLKTPADTLGPASQARDFVSELIAKMKLEGRIQPGE